MLRALIYVRKPDGALDERGYRMLKIIREARKSNERLSIPQFREMLNEQLQLVLLDEERAISALPILLETVEQEKAVALDMFRQLVSAAGALTPEGEKRLARVEALFGLPPPKTRTRGKR